MPADLPPLEIDPKSVAQSLQNGEDLMVLDCREADEYAQVHIQEATFLPMSEIAARIGELSPHRDRHIVVHCHHGGRSLRVTKWLREQGFANVQSMVGGIDQWAVEIDPKLTRY